MKLHWQVGGYVLGTKPLRLKLVTLVLPRINLSIPGIYEVTSPTALEYNCVVSGCGLTSPPDFGDLPC